MAYEKNDSEILFSKNVKAGKRVYYFDVKRDRRGEMYVSLQQIFHRETVCSFMQILCNYLLIS